jgi:hypothetical protein
MDDIQRMNNIRELPLAHGFTGQAFLLQDGTPLYTLKFRVVDGSVITVGLSNDGVSQLIPILQGLLSARPGQTPLQARLPPGSDSRQA